LIQLKFGVYNVAKDSVYFINFLQSHIQDVPKYFELYVKKIKSGEKNKLIIVQEPVYNDDGSDAVSEI
jgi:hypothetical protein